MWCWGPVGCLALSLSASTCSWRCWNMNEWKSRAQFESWLGWGTRACQSLYIRWKYTLDQTLLGASWDPYLSDPSPWDPTSASLRTSGIWQGVYALLPHPLLANCNSCSLGGWGFLRAPNRSPPPPPRQGAGNLQYSHRPAISNHGLLKPWPSSSMPYISQLPLWSQKPKVFAGVSKTHSQNLDAMKPEKGVATIPKHFLLRSYNKQATLLLPVCLLKWVGFFSQTALQWDTS